MPGTRPSILAKSIVGAFCTASIVESLFPCSVVQAGSARSKKTRSRCARQRAFWNPCVLLLSHCTGHRRQHAVRVVVMMAVVLDRKAHCIQAIRAHAACQTAPHPELRYVAAFRNHTYIGK